LYDEPNNELVKITDMNSIRLLFSYKCRYYYDL